MRWLPLLMLLPLAGCLTPCHKANDWALAPEAEPACDWASRSRVHFYIINGSDPFISMAPLREKLQKAGYAKVNSGGLFFVATFEAAIRETHASDPETRFLIVGYGLGTSLAESLASKLANDGIPVDRVVAMAPLVLPGFEKLNGDVPRLVIRTGKRHDGDQTIHISDSRGLNADDAAAEILIGLANESSQVVPPKVETSVAAMPLIDDPAPLPRTPKALKKVPGVLTSQPKP